MPNPPAPARAPDSPARSFWVAATRPSIPAFVGIVAVVVALACATGVFVTPKRLGSMDAGYLMTDPFDTYALLTCRVMEMRAEGLEPDAIVVIGTSALEHAVTSEADLRTLARREGDPEPPIHLLLGPALTLWEMAAVLENLPAGFRGAVVINVTPIGLAPDANYLRRITTNPRLGFSSPYIRRAAAEAGIEMRPLTGVYLLDNAPFFAARVACVRNILTGPRAVGRLYDDRPQLPDPGRWRRMNDFFAEYARGIETQGEAAFGTLADIVALCRERGATTIALLESVLNTRATDEWPAESLALYDAMMREFVEAHAVERWDLSAETGATPDDYVDWVHLKPGGARDRYTRALAQRLAGIVAPAEFAP